MDTDTARQMIADAITEHGRPNWCAIVPMSVRQSLPAADIETMLAAATLDPTVTKTADIIERMMHSWLDDNLFAHITKNDLAIALGIDDAQAARLMTKHADRYRRVGRSVYEIRDARADRAAS